MRCILVTIVLLNILVESLSSPVHIPLARKLHPSVYTRKYHATPPETVPLDGSIEKYGEYFVQVKLATPPVSYLFQIDTGSTDLLVYGIDCKGCPDTTPYDWKSSRTAKLVPCSQPDFTCSTPCYNQTYCGFDDAYGDGSDVRGFVVNDYLAIGNQNVTVPFGSIEICSTDFEPTGVDGIFGLSYPSTSSWDGQSPIFELIQQNGFYNAFSLCLQHDGGAMTVGPDTSSKAISWTPLVTYKGQNVFYPVNLTSIAVGSQNLSVNNQGLNGQFGALLDSGTTLIIITDPAFAAFKTIVEAICSSYQLPGVCNVPAGQSLFDGYCYAMTDADMAHFPSFSITIEGINTPFVISSQNYLILQQVEYWCLGITNSGSEPITILGDVFMRNYYVVFDIENSRLGFAAQSECPNKEELVYLN